MRKSPPRNPTIKASRSCGGEKLYVTVDLPAGTETCWYTLWAVVIGTSLPLTKAFQPFIESSVRSSVVALGQFTVAELSLVLVTVHEDDVGVEKNGRGVGIS